MLSKCNPVTQDPELENTETNSCNNNIKNNQVLGTTNNSKDYIKNQDIIEKYKILDNIISKNNPDELTPKDALNLLYKLKQIIIKN